MYAAPNLMEGYLSVHYAAEALQVHPHTLKRWRARGYGPVPVHVGGRLYYRTSDIQNWLAGCPSAAKAATQ